VVVVAVLLLALFQTVFLRRGASRTGFLNKHLSKLGFSPEQREHINLKKCPSISFCTVVPSMVVKWLNPLVLLFSLLDAQTLPHPCCCCCSSPLVRTIPLIKREGLPLLFLSPHSSIQ